MSLNIKKRRDPRADQELAALTGETITGCPRDH